MRLSETARKDPWIITCVLSLKPLDFGTLYPLRALVNMWESLYSLQNRLALHFFFKPLEPLEHYSLEVYETL